MKRNFFSLFVAVSFLVAGHLQSAATPTPTPKPALKIKSMVVTAPTPAPPPKRIKGTVAGPTSTPIRIDKGTKTGPGPTPIKIGKDQIKAAPSRAPIKVIKTQVSTPTPTPSRKIKDQVTSTATPIRIPKDGVTGGGGRPGPINLGGPTPTPNRKIKDQATSTTTPIRIPKDGVTGTGGRPGPINLGGPTPGSKRLIPGSHNLPPDPAKNVGSDDSVTTTPPRSKRLIPGPNNLPPDPVENLGADNSVLPQPPPPDTGIGNQNQNPVVNGEMPPGANTGTAKGIETKLLVYTKNGWGTASTNLSGEFPAQLASGAMVSPASNNFMLQWSRPQSGKEEKGNLYITKPGQTVWLTAQGVKMPAGSTSVDIPYSINLGSDIYELLIAGESGNSNRVKVIFGSTGTESTVDLSKTGSGGAIPPPAAASITISLTHFKPMKGTPGPSESGYIHPRLIYRVTSSVDMAVPPINFEVNSAAFTDSNTITSSGPASYTPLKLFEKQKKGGGAQLKAGKPASFYVDLDATSDPNWFLAYGKTENATFHWSVPGQASGSAERPVHTAWP